MQATFKQVADPFESLRRAIEVHAASNPDSKIRDIDTALKQLNAVFVSQGATRDKSFGTDIPNGRYHVGVSCGDGQETFFIDVGYAREYGEKIARHLCWYNNEVKVLAEKAPQPFIAVNHYRIGDVYAHRGNMVFMIKDTQNAFSMVYADDHRAGIDSFLLGNKLIQARCGNVRLARPQAVKSVGDNVVALPFRSARPAPSA
jgi:hypothetical protein